MKENRLKIITFDILCAITAGLIVGSAYYFFKIVTDLPPEVLVVSQLSRTTYLRTKSVGQF